MIEATCTKAKEHLILNLNYGMNENKLRFLKRFQVHSIRVRRATCSESKQLDCEHVAVENLWSRAFRTAIYSHS